MKDDLRDVMDELSGEERTALREWMAGPVPGEDRLAAVSVGFAGRVDQRPDAAATLVGRRRRWVRGFMQHAATGVLLFAVGYLLGQSNEVEISGSQPGMASVSHVTPQPEQSDAADAKALDTNTSTGATPAAVPDPLPSPQTAVAQASGAGGADPAGCKAPQIYQGKDGQFRIDAVLCETGSRATWVINPNLELASASKSQTDEETQQ